MTRPMSEEREKLEPCPCCGAAALWAHRSTKNFLFATTTCVDEWRVFCSDCNMETTWSTSKDFMADTWNRRSTSSAERGMREALEKAAKVLHDAAYGGATVTRLIMAEREALARAADRKIHP